MDQSFPGANPANNPRMNLLNGTGGAYGPTAAQPTAPTGGAPRSATSYISAAETGGAAPQPASPSPSPTNTPPRPSYTPMYTGGGNSSSSDSGGGGGRTAIIIGIIVLLLLGVGVFAFFGLNSGGNKQATTQTDQTTQDGQELNTSKINNSDDITTKTIHVTGTDDGVDGLTVDGSSTLQGPVKTGGDLSVGGNLDVTGTITGGSSVTAGEFIGDGSKLTGIATGGGSAGPAGPRGATGPAGAPNPNAVYAATSGKSALTAQCDPMGCVRMQAVGGSSPQVGDINITGSGLFGNTVVAQEGIIVGYAGNQSRISQNPTTGTDPNSLVISNQVPTGDIIFNTNGTANALRIDDGGTITTAKGVVIATGSLNVSSGGILTSGTITSQSNLAATGNITGGGTVQGGLVNSTGDINAIGTVGASALSTNTATGHGFNADAAGNIRVGTGSIFGYAAAINATNGDIASGGNITATGNVSASGDITAGSGHVVSVVNGQFITRNVFNVPTTTLDNSGLVTAGSIQTAGRLDVGYVSSNPGLDHEGANIHAYCQVLSGNTPNCDSNSGVITADNHFNVGGTSGVDKNCSGGQTLNGIVVTGGIVTGGTCTANGSDYAELYPSTQNLAAGTVVAIDPANPEGVVATTYANQASAIGVVSTQPGQTIGVGNTKVALSGRVPVKVEGDAIAPGDYVTSSSTAGYARKAAAGEKTIGQAMSSFAGGTGTVTIFVNVSGGGAVQTEVQTQVPAQTQGQQGSDFTNLNVSGLATVNELTVTGTATVATLNVTGLATVQNLQVNGHIVGNTNTRGSIVIPAGGTTATAPLSGFTGTPVAVASPVSSSVPYHVTTTAAGVTVTIDAPAATDIKFNYLVQQ